MLLTVPAGYKPDDELFFNSSGGGCSVILPSNIKQGDSLQIALPLAAQKIEILNAYFGLDPIESCKDCHSIDPLLEHAASELDIKSQMNYIEANSENLDKCLRTLLYQQSSGDVDFVEAHEVQLSPCRDSTVATGVANPMQPRWGSMSRKVQVPLRGWQTSHLNGIYLLCTLLGPLLTLRTAVDNRTLETFDCLFIFPCVCSSYYSTLDGITYRTNDDLCGSPHEMVVTRNGITDDDVCCYCKIH